MAVEINTTLLLTASNCVRLAEEVRCLAFGVGQGNDRIRSTTSAAKGSSRYEPTSPSSTRRFAREDAFEWALGAA